MKNEKVNGSKAQAEKILSEKDYETAIGEVKQHLATPPTREQVRQWLVSDLQSAVYALSMISKAPDLLDKMADEMWEYAQKSPEQRMQEKISSLPLDQDSVQRLKKLADA